ncbi:hypothetical protein COW36_00325 [bacterium (Candidatus Blackallbacteria) CG17_big_fil_post_rev_8_21_14_2_50_48_46]|uniref:DUF5683 domain-containing protein n=1 Tax=bacterium (Candidatus Blackallbacteria) CG17_big_fil_post_rev_8_21_14_2_50_48_46 TaxID=2014261 RepID=A0A2M7GB06_9BACT|nr:MAG: hypothetical protein COW64_10845 [bacterium (Candidatus Blackallbacteria) CG18_big_fil_WC_8_21_14_2_50_49_26]PIW19320.1 MAG: hypothetical protein COW36_00325 [bacterium (Candidatus Blackallbacteria) CG17_big_fil_post_rev_8_21_14_2_50_48_46]PIW49076.1 MAG: hypothetical protein COW20_08130 [bacterium (Candidatus Blackallbacteria) CG13_big_fil_rev_8_21_14_2_50_49_14]
MAVLKQNKKHSLRSALSAVTAAILLSHTFPGIVQAAEEPVYRFEAATPVVVAQAATSDPLKGMDLKALEAEKQRLKALKAEPEIAALFSVVPGAGHLYAGHTNRGVWVLGGFAATLIVSFLGSYLLSSIDSDIARTAAVIVNVAPPSAYLAWGATDAYYQTALSNQQIEARIREITLKQQEHGYYSTIMELNF